VVDLVSHLAAITPTHLGELLVERVRAWRESRVAAPARLLLDGARDRLEEAGEYLGERRRTTVFAVRDRLRAEARHLGDRRSRLALHARHTLAEADAGLRARRRLLAAYDPARRLAQGWAVVTDAAGALVRSVRAVDVGDEVTVRLGDGRLGAKVTTKEAT
ncbi:MAG TPA: exodeoxyribonuclease VII large subunit, partial [Acidimicrobiales bacterium]|nr:exodeoxyribonuclease VII large subunit [Acidimicrobiales bacterium]